MDTVLKPLHLLAVGDVGRTAAYHVGDEAMLQGLIETMRGTATSIEWTVMSSEPDQTTAAWGVRATPRLTFEDCGGSDERNARLADLDRVLAMPPSSWATQAPRPWRASLGAIAACDAVLLAGGGNLSRSWPHEVFERAAVVRAARRAGRPVVISSQTLGPYFDDRTRELTIELLRDCRVVGLREATSYALALELGVPVERAVLQFDDAVGLRGEAPSWWPELGVNGPFIAVTCNPLADIDSVGGVAAALGRELAEISRRTGAAVVLVPHVGDLHGTPVHDVAMAQRLVAMAGEGQVWRITPLPSPAHAVWLTAQADLVVSSRYHPIVFATATATPSLFLPQDHYTFVKGCGALDLVGLGSWALPVRVAATGGLVPAVDELWERREEVRAHLATLAPTLAARTHRHVDRLLSALTSSARGRDDEPLPRWYGPVARGTWVEAAREDAGMADASPYVTALLQRLTASEGHVESLSAELSRKEAGLVALQTAMAELTRSTEHAHVSWQADRTALVALSEAHEGQARAASDVVAALEAEVGRKDLELQASQAALEEMTRATEQAHAAWQADRTAIVAIAEAHQERARAASEVGATLEAEVRRKDLELQASQAALEDLTRATRDAHAAWAADRAALETHREQVEHRAAAAELVAAELGREVARKEHDLQVAHAALERAAASQLPVASDARWGDVSGPIHACTIVARNYLPSARVFAESLRTVHPDSHITVLVVDGPGEPSDAERFRVLQLRDILPDEDERRRQTFMYDVTELSTAVKPLLLRYLLDEGAAAVLYFDPDIEFFGAVDELWHLAAAHQIVLTPHVLAPIPDDGYEISELAVLRAGVFNLGFVGVGAGATDFLAWWSARLCRHCVSDPGNGLFVDQRWMDYVPALFPHHIVQDPGYNVAYWNLHERHVEQHGDDFVVNGVPLRFYHFSGFSPEVPHLLSKHQGANPRALLSEHPAVRELCRRYATRLRARGHGAVSAAYGHATLPDGTPIDFVMRRVFRRELLHASNRQAPIPPEPFGWDHMLDWLNAPATEAPRLSRYLFGLFQERGDLQREFRTPLGAGAEAYLNWVTHDPWARTAIPEALRPRPVTGMLQPPPDEDTGEACATDGLNIAGYFKAELGVGEIARLMTAAARREGLPVATAVNDRTLSRQQDGFEIHSSDVTYPVTLVCANADEYPRAVDALPPAMRDVRHRIGFWFWETERLPHAFAPSANLLDEVWVASEYVAAAVRAVIDKPVRVCPVPLRQLQPAALDRAGLGLPDGYLFLFMFDFLSNIHRKNPIGLVRAFCRAFRPGEGPTLLIKSINGHLARGAQEELHAAVGDRPDVRLMDEYLAGDRRDALLQACDSYVSLHRSEGYGLTMAEAMSLGKPTIATGYSGNLAFMTPENSFLVPCTRSMVPANGGPYPTGDWWAEPDLDAAAAIMRAVYEDPALARDRGERGRLEVTARCSSARTVAFVRERLAAIHRPPVLEVETPVVAAAPAPEPEPVSAEPEDAQPEIVEPQAQIPPAGGLDAETLDALRAELRQAERDAQEAAAMLTDGITFRTPSRFGWPGRVLRTTVLRLIRPYANFQVRAHHLHLQSTRRMIECLRIDLPGPSESTREAAPGPASPEPAEEPSLHELACGEVATRDPE